jgi:hypothetical protein
MDLDILDVVLQVRPFGAGTFWDEFFGFPDVDLFGDRFFDVVDIDLLFFCYNCYGSVVRRQVDLFDLVLVLF